MSILKSDIQISVGNTQVCAGHRRGCEVSVHALVDMFNDDETEGVIQVDASNAFNSLNRNVLHHNVKIICPEFSTYIYNSYCVPTCLFVIGGTEIKSQEGTTQGDPISMGAYGIGLMPLLNRLSSETSNSVDNIQKQSAFADDVNGAGSISSLRHWWDILNLYGPYIGYYPNADKSWLTVKENVFENAINSFDGTGINITTYGHKHLGAVIGTDAFKTSYMTNKVDEWISEINKLSIIARTQPQSAYACFTKGILHKYIYVMRTIPDISNLLQPLDAFIKIIFNNYEFNEEERELWSLPIRYGGLGLIIPSEMSDREYENSRLINAALISKVYNQNQIFEKENNHNKNIKSQVKAEKTKIHETKLEHLKNKLTCPGKIRALTASLEKGASSWLNALPIKDLGFMLDKQSFWDSLYLRYNIPLTRLPSSCVCGNKFSVEHALNCMKGGFISQRHNEVRRITAEILSEVCRDVEQEPELQQLTGEHFRLKTASTEDNARVDVVARDFWVKGQKAFCDVRVFNPLAKSYRTQSLEGAHLTNEKEKKIKYAERILQVEHGSFTPLVFTCFGGMSKECQKFYQRLSELLAEKRNIDNSEAANYIRTKLSFSLLRSSLICIRGSRSHQLKRKVPISETDIELANFISDIN